MKGRPVRPPSSPVLEHGTDSLPRLAHVIEHAAHLLPAQGPIPVFIHHNTLHAFEHLPFTEAVLKGGALFGCQPYLPEERYRAELARGRIRYRGLEDVLCEDLGELADLPVGPRCTRYRLRLAMLHFPVPVGTTDELLWLVAETDALRRVRPEVSAADRARLVSETRRWALRDLRGGHEGPGVAGRAGNGLADLFDRFRRGWVESWDETDWEAFTLQALWRVCRAGVADVPAHPPLPTRSVRHRDLLLEATGQDSDLPVNALLTQFCAAFLDQGVSHWGVPNREGGFFDCFQALYRQSGPVAAPWRRGLAAELARIAAGRLSPLASVHESLTLLGVPEAEWETYVSDTLLVLRGWAGIIRFLEDWPDRAVQPPPKGTLIGYLAVRLILDRLSVAHVARSALGYAGPLSGMREELRTRTPPPPAPSTEQRAFPVFQLAQVLGWTPEELKQLRPAEWETLLREVEAFPSLERRRVFHLAYERRFYIRTLDALALHPRHHRQAPPRFQAVVCIDEREESLRRHLEEAAPDCETFGAAGFFAVPMYYRGVDHAHYTPLCPVIVRPGHWVAEEARQGESDGRRWRARLRRWVGAASYRVHVGSRGFLQAAVVAAAGVVASVPLVARTLFPRLASRMRRRVVRIVRPRATRLRLERSAPVPGPTPPAVGFTREEMVGMAERLLRDIGLTAGFARLVFILGHGSDSQNNPHKSAYDCGACGGSPGGPNGRAAAEILNDPPVRRLLVERGIAIPDSTHFVGGQHNTCDDSITLADLDRVPATHLQDLEWARRDFENAGGRNAHERCRRFQSAPLTLTFAEARQHVEGRSADLAQARPELGHATNAIVHVGRRARTRGLFLDRRAFLVAYDPTQDDPAGTVLARTMAAVFPVCGGINLEYYFSHVDPAGYGCGTKLPHNVAGLLGVMDGAASDLRTGLPTQMTEIHEPVRLLIVCETTPEVMRRVLDGNPAGKALVDHRWLMLAVQSPDTNDLRVYEGGEFRAYQPQASQLPQAASSLDWYRGWRDHLEFAEIRS